MRSFFAPGFTSLGMIILVVGSIMSFEWLYTSVPLGANAARKTLTRRGRIDWPSDAMRRMIAYPSRSIKVPLLSHELPTKASPSSSLTARRSSEASCLTTEVMDSPAIDDGLGVSSTDT